MDFELARTDAPGGHGPRLAAGRLQMCLQAKCQRHVLSVREVRVKSRYSRLNRASYCVPPDARAVFSAAKNRSKKSSPALFTSCWTSIASPNTIEGSLLAS